jgi:hypothetical protein
MSPSNHRTRNHRTRDVQTYDMGHVLRPYNEYDEWQKKPRYTVELPAHDDADRTGAGLFGQGKPLHQPEGPLEQRKERKGMQTNGRTG